MSIGQNGQKLDGQLFTHSMMDSDDDLNLFINVSSNYSPSFSQHDDVALLNSSVFSNEGQFLLVPQPVVNDSIVGSICGDQASLGTQSDISGTNNMNDTASVSQASTGGRLQHSEIEKRRRDKMNMYITELSNMVPMCHSMNRKLDKLTVLRMTVQQLKTLKGNTVPCTEASQRPSFLSDQDLKHLILKVADGFLFVLACERGRFLYVSESVKNVLEYQPHELVGQSIFDVIHSRDVAMVKEHLLSSVISPKEKLIDAKTLLPIKAKLPKNYTRLCSGSRRSFYCRFRIGNVNSRNGASGKRIKTENKRYTTLHCTGYIKSWASQENDTESSELFSSNGDDDCSSQLACLVMIGRPIPTHVHHDANKDYQFVTRHGLDGKFSYIDQRATPLLGFLPQELLGTSIYEYLHHDDAEILASSHRKAIRKGNFVPVDMAPVRLRTKWGAYIMGKINICCFFNPLTDEPEFLICRHSLSPDNASLFEIMRGVNLWIETAGNQQDKVNASTNPNAARIGSSIAEEIYELQRSGETEFLNKMIWQCIRQYAECNSTIESDHLKPPSLSQASASSQQSDGEAPKKIQVLLPTSESGNGPTEVASLPTTSRTALTDIDGLSVRPSTSVELGNNGSLSNLQSINSFPRGPVISGGDTRLMGSRPNGLSVHLSDTIELPGPSNASGPLLMTSEDSDSQNQVSRNTRGSGHVTDAAHLEASVTATSHTDANDETTMSVVMSLLEADAGLGGPVDLTNIPWPL